jgi:hypothetical protein
MCHLLVSDEKTLLILFYDRTGIAGIISYFSSIEFVREVDDCVGGMTAEETAAIALLTRACQLDKEKRYTEVRK